MDLTSTPWVDGHRFLGCFFFSPFNTPSLRGDRKMCINTLADDQED